MKKPALFVFIVLFGQIAPAWSSFVRTAEETQLCKSLQITNHECDCVRFINRAMRSMKDEAEFKYNLGEAIGGCNYNLTHSPGSPWNANAYYQIGLAQHLLKKPVEAVTAFNNAIRLNPRYEQGYSELANVLMSMKSKENALKTVSEGLRWLPDSKVLQRKYKRYGGILPYPPPHEQAIPPAPTNAASVTGTEQPSGTPSEQSAAAVPIIKASETPSRPDAALSAVIGSPTNPWCRFCPDTPAAPAVASPATPGAIPTDWQ